MGPGVDTARTVGDISQVTRIRTAEREGVERVVQASSRRVSDETNAEHRLEMADPAPGNPQAKSILAGEQVRRESTVNTGCRGLATNYGWRPGIRFNLVTDDFVFRALHDEPPTVSGDGPTWWPFILTRNRAGAFRRALARNPGVHNVVEASLRLDDAEAAISGAVGSPVGTTNLEDGDPGPPDLGAVSKVRGQGHMPEIGFLKGIEQLVVWCRPRRTPREAHG